MLSLFLPVLGEDVLLILRRERSRNQAGGADCDGRVVLSCIDSRWAAARPSCRRVRREFVDVDGPDDVRASSGHPTLSARAAEVVHTVDSLEDDVLVFKVA